MCNRTGSLVARVVTNGIKVVPTQGVDGWLDHGAAGMLHNSRGRKCNAPKFQVKSKQFKGIENAIHINKVHLSFRESIYQSVLDLEQSYDG